MENNNNPYRKIEKKEMVKIHGGVIINGSKILHWIIKLFAPEHIV